MEELKTQDKVLTKNTGVVEMMYGLLQQYKVAIPTEDIVAMEDLKNLQLQYQTETVRRTPLTPPTPTTCLPTHAQHASTPTDRQSTRSGQSCTN
jgi:hypothetical protein